MKLLYIGDIMARPGRRVVAKVLPDIKKEYAVDIVAAQAENVSHGVAMSKAHYAALKKVGIDFFTGGNHSVERKETMLMVEGPEYPVIAPANMPRIKQPAYKILQTKKGVVAFVSLLGATYPKGMADGVVNPLVYADEVLPQMAEHKPVATIVNFHGDVTADKRVVGYYLDGRVSAVIGDHWHIPTADAMVLPNGTAHVSDVGMCGTLHSSLGVRLDAIIPRWRDGKRNRNVIDTKPPYQFNAVLIDVDEQTGLARSIERIQRIVETV